ncbi:uncharacterized protein [Parasteatoda tepidariorum]|uniref:uncharacterized protein n=1 Tax=Parasteatoda tepidariorum TaxID=114398 RepID=UPI0039BC2244
MATKRKNEAYGKMRSKRHSRNSVFAYKDARREEKGIHKTQKWKFFEDLFKNVEHLRDTNKSRAFFREINLVRKEFKPRTTSCRNKEGVILSDRTEVLTRWNEHFDCLLNTDNDGYEIRTENIQTASQDVTVPLEEVAEGINKLKDNKARGHDAIPSELLKNGGI